MKNHELIAILNELNPDAEIVVMTSHDGGDDLTDWQVYAVHDAWSRKVDHDMISIEVNLDQRPHSGYPAELGDAAELAIDAMVAQGLAKVYLDDDGREMVELTELGKERAIRISH